MTGRDFRIGNRISVSKSTFNIQFDKIICGIPNRKEIILENGDCELKIDAQMCIGIPITSDRLKKAGYFAAGKVHNISTLAQEDEGSDMHGALDFQNSKGHSIYFLDNEWHFELCHLHDEFERHIKTVPMKYIHQWQNIHRAINRVDLIFIP